MTRTGRAPIIGPIVVLAKVNGGPRYGPPNPPALGSAPGNPGRSSIAWLPLLVHLATSPSRSWLLFRGVVNLAEVDPPLAVELGELLLLDRVEVRRPGVDLDTRQQHRQPEIL